MAVPADEARVPALDRGLLLGEGVYETLKVVAGTPFALTRHLARLRRSAAVVGLEVPWDDGALRTACEAVVAAARGGGGWPGDLGRLRLTVTGGAAPLGPGAVAASPALVVAAGPGTAWAGPARLATVPWTRNPDRPSRGAKVTSALDDVLALAEARRRDADEAVLATPAGVLAEGTGSNVFVVLDGVLSTPSLATGCLPGVTRELVCELVPVVPRDDLTLADLRRADEAFVTSSTRDVQPVASVDGVALPSVPGPATEAVVAAFGSLQGSASDP
ncbi:MAG: aminotransferase class IV family protein [Actinobacteria bacterium]|nr:aminotransferase class IV family protein [Actinomycetota bacterium]